MRCIKSNGCRHFTTSCHFLGCNNLILRIKQIQSHFRTALQLQLNSQRTVFIFAIQIGSYTNIIYTVFISCIKIAVAGNTCITEKILIFQITAVAPAEYLKSNYILLPRLQIRSKIKFSFQLTIFAITDKFSIHPYIIERNDSFTTQYYPASFPVSRHFEGTSVGADFILRIRHQRRILLEVEHFIIKLIRFVDIDSRAIPLAFPVTGHIDIRPSSCIIRRLVKVLRTIIGILHPMEFPLSVQAHIKRRLFIPSRLFNVGSVGIRPYVCVRSELVQSHRILALPFGQRLLLR